MTIETEDLKRNSAQGHAPVLLVNIQALRGIAAMLVVISHLFVIERKYSPDQILGGWAEYGGVGVDLFFVISGFIMVFITRDRDVSARRGLAQTGEFWLARALRVYPLYWVISLAVLILFLLRPDMVFSSLTEPPNIAASFALFPQSRPPLLAVGWTLVHEVYFYLVFGAFLLLSRKWLPWLLGGWAAATLIGAMAGLREINAVLSVIFSPMTLEFCAGAFAALLLAKEGRLAISRRTAWIAIIIGMTMLALSIAALALTSDLTAAQMLNNHSVRTLIFIGPAFMIVFGLARLDWVRVHASASAKALGDWSYAIYLTHVLTLTVLGRMWAFFAGPKLADNIVMLPLLLAGSVVAGWLTFILVERPLIKAAKSIRRKAFPPI